MEITVGLIGQLRVKYIVSQAERAERAWDVNYYAAAGYSQRERAKASSALLRAERDLARAASALRDAEYQFLDDAGRVTPATPAELTSGPR